MKNFTNLAHRAFKKCASLGTINKKRYYLFVITMLLTLGVGNAWGADDVIDYSTTKSALNSTATSTWKNPDLNITGASGAQYVIHSMGTKGTTNALQWNKNGFLYQTKSGGTLKSVIIKGTNGKSVKIYASTSAYSGAASGTAIATLNLTGSDVTYTFEENSNYTFLAINGSVSNTSIVSITVTYETAGGGDPTPSLTTDPTTIDFGTVYEGATVADKTVAVNFANLIGNVTYSSLSTPFSATGAIAATGDNITISADASTIGEYSQTLTVASTADSKTAEVTVKMNVVEKPAPTGTFTLHTGELIEGDYVIYYSGKAMKPLLDTKNRLQYEEVTPTDNKIVDPLVATIWHIAPSGTNWTVYNENVSKYAAGTGTKSEADLVADLTGDNANKAAWTVTASGNAYEFVNVWNKSKSVNANLRNNGTYGFACYATSTGGALSLYRKAGTKYNVTVSSTTNGSVTADPTSAEAGTTIALTITPDAGYVLDALTVTDASSNTVTVTNNEFTMPASDVTVTATFKENEKPAATLTLSKNGVAETFPGSWKQDDVVTLPSITSDCVKEFVGWSANASCATEPEYKAGDEYTLASTTQTLYAVYADVTGGETVNIKHNLPTTATSTNMTGNNDAETFFDLDATKWSLVSAKGGANNHIGVNKGGTLRLYYHADGGSTLTITAPKTIATVVLTFSEGKNNAWVKVGGNTITPVDGVYTINATTFVIGNANTTNVQVYIAQIDVTLQGEYSNYSTTCDAAPIATVNPTSVTATAAGVNGTLEASYENVNTANVAVALFNDEACTEAFTAGWLTAALDGDKNVTYTVAENTTYAERKAYIQLTAPETTGATDPNVVVIPVTQAGKEKVFASLAELVAADLTAGDEVTVTLNNDVIKDFYIYNSNRAGVVFDVQKDGKDIKIYFNNQTTIVDWAVGGKLSGTLTNVKWTTYSSAWQLAPDYNTWAWANLTYTEPKAVSTVVVSGAPTKTTYVDGEAFDPAGLTVTVNYNDATSEVNPTGVTFDVTPATLTKGETSVSVTATYNTVSSAPYEVTGLTVNDIPTKTVAEFIAAGGTRCYLEGIVSNITNTTYGNFDLTDASGTIYVYGCLNGAGESQKFAELGVKNGDKIKVIADDYELYGGTKDEAMNVQYVSHVPAATITIADITMEVEEVKTISAAVEPAEAEVTYTIKENAANAISLSGNTITALAEGTATITATVAEGATYMGNSVDFTVTVGPKTESEEVVILAEYNGRWYALKAETGSSTNSLAALVEVEYFNGVLYNVDEADKASITWKRTIVGNFETFQYGDKYLKGSSSTNLFIEDGTVGKYQWDKDTHTMRINSTDRTFLYQGTYFKNYAISNAGRTVDGTTYSALPVVTAAKFETATFYTRSELPVGSYGTICLPYAVNNYTGATFYEVAGKEDSKIVFDEVSELEAGKPYIFMAEAAEIKLAQVGEEYTGSAKLHNSLQGTFTQIDPALDNILVGNYMLVNNIIKKCGINCGLKANRAYFVAAELENNLGAAPQPMPGRRRVTMGVTGENEATGVDNITENGVIAPKKLIENGQLIIIRDGVKYNVQGVRF